MKVTIDKWEAQELYEKTGQLKYRILAEMVDWSTDPTFLPELVRRAQKEYNELRCFAGENYPEGHCDNLIELFEVLEK